MAKLTCDGNPTLGGLAKVQHISHRKTPIKILRDFESWRTMTYIGFMAFEDILDVLG